MATTKSALARIAAALARHQEVATRQLASGKKPSEIEYVRYKEKNRRVIQRLPDGMIRLSMGIRQHKEVVADIPERDTSSTAVEVYDIRNAGFRPVRCSGTYVKLRQARL